MNCYVAEQCDKSVCDQIRCSGLDQAVLDALEASFFFEVLGGACGGVGGGIL